MLKHIHKINSFKFIDTDHLYFTHLTGAFSTHGSTELRARERAHGLRLSRVCVCVCVRAYPSSKIIRCGDLNKCMFAECKCNTFILIIEGLSWIWFVHLCGILTGQTGTYGRINQMYKPVEGIVWNIFRKRSFCCIVDTGIFYRLLKPFLFMHFFIFFSIISIMSDKGG